MNGTLGACVRLALGRFYFELSAVGSPDNRGFYYMYLFVQVADDGLQQSVEEELSPPPAPCPRAMHESTSYQDISVPVYATVKGVSFETYFLFAHRDRKKNPLKKI